MKITVWRIVREKYLDKALTGEGAKLWGGRWNPVGQPAVYCAGHLSLGILEMIVHLDEYIDIHRFVAVPVSFEEKSVWTLSSDQLPGGWNELPIGPASIAVGEKWLNEKKHMVLSVPSIIVPLEHNYIIDPLHIDFTSIESGTPRKIRLDPRLYNLIAGKKPEQSLSH